MSEILQFNCARFLDFRWNSFIFESREFDEYHNTKLLQHISLIYHIRTKKKCYYNRDNYFLLTSDIYLSIACHSNARCVLLKPRDDRQTNKKYLAFLEALRFYHSCAHIPLRHCRIVGKKKINEKLRELEI